MTDILAAPGGTALDQALEHSIGRHIEKIWDWDASGQPRLPGTRTGADALHRSGGSPKTTDETSLQPRHFTTSLLYQDPLRCVAMHTHEIEEIS